MGKAAKAPKKRGKGNADDDAAVSDERFSRVHSDPRFQRINKVRRRCRPQNPPARVGARAEAARASAHRTGRIRALSGARTPGRRQKAARGADLVGSRVRRRRRRYERCRAPALVNVSSYGTVHRPPRSADASRPPWRG